MYPSNLIITEKDHCIFRILGRIIFPLTSPFAASPSFLRQEDPFLMSPTEKNFNFQCSIQDPLVNPPPSVFSFFFTIIHSGRARDQALLLPFPASLFREAKPVWIFDSFLPW